MDRRVRVSMGGGDGTSRVESRVRGLKRQGQKSSHCIKQGVCSGTCRDNKRGREEGGTGATCWLSRCITAACWLSRCITAAPLPPSAPPPARPLTPPLQWTAAVRHLPRQTTPPPAARGEPSQPATYRISRRPADAMLEWGAGWLAACLPAQEGHAAAHSLLTAGMTVGNLQQQKQQSTQAPLNSPPPGCHRRCR